MNESILEMKYFARLVSCIAFAVSSLPLAALAQVSVVPASPKSQETVRVQVAPLQIRADAFDPDHRRVSMSGNKITVELPLPGASFLPPSPPTPALDIALGQFPAGQYEVEVIRHVSVTSTESIGTSSFTVTQDSDPLSPIQNNTDLWWNPDESGWGLNIVQHGSGVIFATWFNYAPDNRATWYVIPTGHWESNTRFVGPIYQTTGPEVGDVFDPSLVTRTLVGSAALVFSGKDSNQMAAQFTIGNKTFTKNLVRQGF